MSYDTKKRGRPPLPPEQRKERKTSKSGVSSTKAGGYASQKRYRENHPDRVREQRRKRQNALYEPKLHIPVENKPVLEKLLAETGYNLTQLCLSAVEEKYGVTLQNKKLDKTKH